MLKKKLQKIKEYHSVLELAIIQGANAIFPVLVFPFFLITLGENIFSSIAVGEVLALYVLIFSLYSFDIISVQKVISSVTKDEIFKVYILTLICRLCLFVISGICLLFITYLINKTLSVYLGLFLLYPVGMILQSNYFFQATNNNRPLAVFVLIARGMSLCLIYFYNGPAGYLTSYYYVICVSGSYFLSGVLSLIYIYYQNKTNKAKIQWAEILEYICTGYHLFIANIFVILYRNSNIIILGTLASPVATSLYATAEKIIKCIQSIATPLNQYYFTRLIKQHELKLEPYKVGEYKSLLYASTNIQLKFMVFIVLSLGGVGTILGYKVQSIA
ncbi:O26 family O-antigen flippase, partial [Escherichia coli]|nr:O26 family O-antigen flippase [Escherichia coli]